MPTLVYDFEEKNYHKNYRFYMKSILLPINYIFAQD